MSTQDVIKKSVLDLGMFNKVFSLELIVNITLNMLLALAMGFIIYKVYKKYFEGVIFSKSFAMTLVGMTVLTCMVTLAISTNIVISLGMVGALSIVRYRTAIKEPSDLLYVFWAITSGITIGANMYILVAIGGIFMVLMLHLLRRQAENKNSYIMIVHYTGDEAGDRTVKALGGLKYSIKSKTMRNEETELTLQVMCKESNMAFTERVRDLDGVKDVTLVQYYGEYHG